MAGVAPVGLGSPFAAPQHGRIRRFGPVPLHAGPSELLGHEPPPGAALQRERHLTPPGQRFQPASQVIPGRGTDLTGANLTGLGVHPVECDLGSMHVKTTYDCHWGLLEFLNRRKVSHLVLCRGGPPHMSSFGQAIDKWTTDPVWQG